jgi:hypothetical protein
MQSIEIYDLNGRIANAKLFINTIDISKLSASIYVLKIQYTDNTIATKYYFKK